MDTQKISELIINQNNKIIKYEKALKFYSDRKNYIINSIRTVSIDEKKKRVYISEVDADSGDLAREALDL